MMGIEIDSNKAEIIATRFLEQYFSVLKVEQTVLEDDIWTVIVLLLSSDNQMRKIRIDAKTGKIIDWLKVKNYQPISTKKIIPTIIKKQNHQAQNNDLVKKALVSLTIEKALLDIRKETYDRVANELYERHHSYFSDCYEHPEYLNEILEQLYGSAHGEIIKSIKKQLDEFSDYEPIAKFLKVIA